MKAAVLIALVLFSAHARADELFPTPQSPDALIDNFTRAINERNADEYARTLHPAFRFVFAPEQQHLAFPEGSWNRDQELRSMSRLLMIQPHSKEAWSVENTVSSIRFSVAPRGDWRHTPGVLETWTRTYDSVLITVWDSGRRAVAKRQQILTVTAKRSECDLRPTEFQMLRWQEAGCAAVPKRLLKLARGTF